VLSTRSRNSIDEWLPIPAVFVVKPNTAVMPSADVTEASKRDGLREAVAISWRASETSSNWLRSSTEARKRNRRFEQQSLICVGVKLRGTSDDEAEASK